MAIFEPIASEGTRRKLQLRSPIDLQVIGEIECATAEDVRAAVERARKAQPEWAALSFEQRAKVVYRFIDRFIERQDEIIELVTKETGKARSEAISMEVFAPMAAATYYAKRAKKFLKPRKRRIAGLLGLAKQLRVAYVPLGVAGIITPWNGPVALAVNPIVQALMAGNTVVLKPSEVTPFSSQLVAEIFAQAGLPENVLQVIVGDGETGAALCEAGVDKISFTGSVATGRKVAASCGQQLIPCTLELGGKDAMIVCSDADIDRAASGAVIGSCMNTGQYCCGTERIYVVDEHYDEFVDKVVGKAKALRQGTSGEFDVGAIFWDKQLEIVERHVEDAKARGAKVLVGGRRNPDLDGLYYEPTVLVDVDHDMDVMKHETFGPVISIMRVADEEEAIRLANDSDYGLNGNVWTRDKEKGFQIAQRIETGAVCVNDMALTYGVPEAPFGGRKQSGVGQVNGKKGIRAYCHELPVLIDRRGGKEVQGGYPYTRKAEDVTIKVVKFLFGNAVLRKWLG
jgi:succinate-semialdehyde dehydrogenase/glutarate-semialdehyde dehydrogenase